jgi:hypothetical protein
MARLPVAAHQVPAGAVAAGEPPAKWWGEGAQELGLTSGVEPSVMEAVYSDFLDPRDPLFARPGYTATVRTVRPCPQEVPHPEEEWRGDVPA